jgi:hypothetical protein
MNRRRAILSSAVLQTPEASSKAKTPPANSNEIAPMFCSINDWCRLSGVSRSATYKAIADGWLPTLKVGKSRLIDFYPAIAAFRTQYGARQAA